MKTERQAIVTELRNLGDNTAVVLYTNDNQLYRKLRDSADYIKIVPYEQEQGGKIAMVGVDLYFCKKYRRWLEQNIGKTE